MLHRPEEYARFLESEKAKDLPPSQTREARAWVADVHKSLIILLLLWGGSETIKRIVPPQKVAQPREEVSVPQKPLSLDAVRQAIVMTEEYALQRTPFLDKEHAALVEKLMQMLRSAQFTPDAGDTHQSVFLGAPKLPEMLRLWPTLNASIPPDMSVYGSPTDSNDNDPPSTPYFLLPSTLPAEPEATALHMLAGAYRVRLQSKNGQRAEAMLHVEYTIERFIQNLLLSHGEVPDSSLHETH